MNYADALKKAQAAKALQDVMPAFHEWKKEGELIVGMFRMFEVLEGRKENKYFNIYTFETDEGMVRFTLGAMIDGQAAELLKPGLVYAITFKGQETIASGNKMNSFSVEYVPIEGVEAIDEETGEVL